VIPGPQDDHFTEEGLATFYASEYVITNSADRMGFRLEGPIIAHKESADIISDAICLGSVQVPGHGQPLVMLADRQTTGGYTKIATVCAVDVENLAQRLPGEKVHFEKITVETAIDLLRREEELVGEVKRLRAAWRTRPNIQKGTLRIRVNGKLHHVEWSNLN
jgi:allophanate hydrolase subunit 2